MVSTKIPQVYIEGCFNYTSDVKAKHSDIVIGESYYNDFFCNSESTNYNIPFKHDSFISRIKIKENHSYIESNEPLNNTEIKALKYIEKTFNEEYIKQENEFKEWLKENNIEFNGWIIYLPFSTRFSLIITIFAASEPPQNSTKKKRGTTGYVQRLNIKNLNILRVFD